MFMKLSIVVPVYNVAAYLDRFLGSLTKNLMPGIEVILVDDGSTDESGDIIDRYYSEYVEFTKVIHKANGGVSSARNAGMKHANGEYVLFLDPDDFITDTCTKDIFAAIDKYGRPDMVLFDYYRCQRNHQDLKRAKNINVGIVPMAAFIREFVKDTSIKSYLWHKVLKKKCIVDIDFDETIKNMEDALYFTEVVLRFKSVAYCPMPIYYYCIRERANTFNGDMRGAEKCFDIAYDRYIRLRKIVPDISIVMPISYAIMVLRLAHRFSVAPLIDVSRYVDFVKGNIGKVLGGAEFSFNEKKHCILIYLGIAKYYYAKKFSGN